MKTAGYSLDRYGPEQTREQILFEVSDDTRQKEYQAIRKKGKIKKKNYNHLEGATI